MGAMSKRYLWLGLSVAIVAAIGYGIFRFFNPSVGFTYYEPSYLPARTSIKARQIYLFVPSSRFMVEQNFRTENWIYSISEYKTDSGIGSAMQDYDAKSVKPTCNINTTPVKTRYRLCHWIDYGKIDVHEVRFYKGETFVRSFIPTELSQEISIQEIEKYIDSFSPKSTIGLPVLRSNGA